MRSDSPLADGYYVHYKGGLYQCLAVARHTEIEEIGVVYRRMHARGRGTTEVYYRPLESWMSELPAAGNKRFRRV